MGIPSTYYANCVTYCTWINPNPTQYTVITKTRVRADSHYKFTFPFRRGTSPFSKISSRVIKRRCSHWQELLRHVSVPFRRRCWARMFDVTERVRTGLYLLDSDEVNSLTSPALHLECLLATSAACFSSEVDEKLIELVRKCEELYDVANKKYSDRVWKETLNFTVTQF